MRRLDVDTGNEPVKDSATDRSAEVRAFYEAHPYPAPITDLSGYRDLWDSPERCREAFHLLWPTEPERADLEILVAGCGTSQAARHALRQPGARVTGIDLSEASLEHTRDLARTYEIDNLELHQLPLERVRELDRRFDKIVCTGVLHHLLDPDAGLRALRSVLAQGGALHGMVYAAYGRTGIYMMQEYCRRLNIRTTLPELEDLARTLGATSPGHPISHLLEHAKDFRTPAALADALLNPQDRAYTVPEVYEWLGRCGFSFGRWFHQAPYQPACGVVSGTPQATRLAELPEPEQQAALELLRGSMVKHEFVAYGDDHPTEVQPIRFDGDAWIDYVPVRRASTLRVTEQLPEGVASVLINRAHTFTDIFLPVDPTQDGWVRAIDGEQTIGEILQSDATGADEPARLEHARRLFQRLWLFDQVVFNASSGRF